ncbi:MAG: DUF4258 domain-containing protein [Chloroflexi bacterium]|nr:DUF4258 domain-containing protein [Chloroflexota bacterium]
MKPLFFKRHARNRMRQYRITRDEVELILDTPDLVEPDDRRHLNATKVLPDNRVIRVTFVEEANQIVVVTVTPRRRLNRGHRNGV